MNFYSFSFRMVGFSQLLKGLSHINPRMYKQSHTHTDDDPRSLSSFLISSAVHIYDYR